MSETIALKEAFILHRYVYSESGLILRVLSPDFPILSIVAKRARQKTKYGSMAGLYEPFLKLNLTYLGRTELKKLKDLEICSDSPKKIYDRAILIALYLNELILNLLGPSVCSLSLFKCYEDCLNLLTHTPDLNSVFWMLRRFEKKILEEAGHGMELFIDQNDKKIDQNLIYEVRPGGLPLEVSKEFFLEDQTYLFSGKTLIKIRELGYLNRDRNILDSKLDVKKEIKKIFRQWIDFYTFGKLQKTRNLMREVYSSPLDNSSEEIIK